MTRDFDTLDFTLTPKNINALVTTEYASSSVKQVGGGRNVYFVYDKGTYSGIREYFVDADADVHDAEDVTGNVPKYIPSNVYKLSISTLIEISSLLILVFKILLVSSEFISLSKSTRFISFYLF